MHASTAAYLFSQISISLFGEGNSKSSCFGQQAAVASKRPKQPQINAAEAAAISFPSTRAVGTPSLCNIFGKT